MQLAGRVAEAHRLLDFVSDCLLRPNGDLTTTEQPETVDPVVSLYPGYANGWIGIAAHNVGRFEIGFSARAHLCGCRGPELGGFTLEHAEIGSESPGEVLMSAHLRRVRLFCNDGTQWGNNGLARR